MEWKHFLFKPQQPSPDMSECTIYYAKIEIESSFLGHIRRFQHGLETNHGLQILYSWISIHSIGSSCSINYTIGWETETECGRKEINGRLLIHYDHDRPWVDIQKMLFWEVKFDLRNKDILLDVTSWSVSSFSGMVKHASKHHFPSRSVPTALVVEQC